MEAIGNIAAVCYLLSAIPLVWQSLTTGKVDVPWSMIGLVILGAACMGTYAVSIDVYPVAINQVLTGMSWSIIAGIKSLGMHNVRK